MTKLTKETINHLLQTINRLLQPGVLFHSDGTIVAIKPLVGEDLENANAAYRGGFLHEDIDAVLADVNAKRGFAPEKDADTDEDVNQRPAPSSFGLNTPLADIFGVGAVLHDVEIDYHGITIRIGSVDL